MLKYDYKNKGGYVVMNRKQRRELKKDKNLLNELYSIIKKYLPELLDRFNNLTDMRNQSYIKYSMKVICVTRLFPLLCGITTMTDISSDYFNTDNCINNLSNICNEQLKELPYWETIQDVFENINIDELRDIQKYIIKALIRSKMFDKYKYNGYFQLVMDGSGLSSHSYNLNNNCIKKKYKDGHIAYCKYILECKLIAGNLVLSLDSEWIENEKNLSDKQKQDCEIKAFKRMATRVKQNYQKYKFIITADALYCTSPIMDICNKMNWKFIFNFNERLKTVWKDFNDYIKYFNDCNLNNYYLDKNYKYKNQVFNIIKFTLNKKGKVTNFHYITNLETKDNNIKDIVCLGRNRWKIENQGFYTQKHRTFNITHLNSRNDIAMKNHYLFIQIAHTIRQLLEQGNILVKSLNLKIKEVSRLLLTSLTSTTSDLNHLQTNFQLRFDT